MISSLNPPEGNPPRLDPDKMRDALSSRVRTEILMILERHERTLEALQQDLSGGHSIEDLKYHVEILQAADLLESTTPEMSTDPVVYRLKRDVLLDPRFLSHQVAIEDQESPFCNWLELQVDEVGEAQLLEVMRAARLQFLMAEEQSQGRSEMSDQKLRRVVVGVVGFYPTTPEDGK